MTSRVLTAVRTFGPYLIGPSILGSSLVFMVYGLWVGAWYGYVFAAIIIAQGALIAALIYWGKTVADAEFRKAIHALEREMERQGEDDG